MFTYSTLVQDTGQRANENPINPKVWTVPPFASAPLQVLNNEISCSSISGVNQATYTRINWPNNQWAELRLDSLGSGTSGVVQLRIRSSLSASTHYGLEVQGPFGSTAFLILFSRINNIVLKEWISISAIGLNVGSINKGDVIRLESYENQIFAKVNGIILGGPGIPTFPIIDNTISSGSPNITMTDVSSIADTQVSYFSGGCVSYGWSPWDSRQIPNIGIVDSQNNVNYSLPGSQTSSNDPADSRVTKSVDSRNSVPQNSRNSPVFG